MALLVSDPKVENHLLRHCLQMLFDPPPDYFLLERVIALRALCLPLIRVVVLGSDNLAKCYLVDATGRID